MLTQTLRARLADLRRRGVYSGWPDEHRAIFIHLPKTAGTSVSQALGLSSSRHVEISFYQIANPKKFEKYFKFGFVRNPFDRLVSSYTFLKSGGMNTGDEHFSRSYILKYENFEHFVLEGLELNSILNWVHFRQQVEFICDSKRNNLLDFTGRFETLASDYAEIASRLGKPEELSVVNKSARGDYREMFSARMIDKVRQVYAADLEVFSYGFE